MADVTINIAHRVFIVRPRYLLYFFHSTACLPPCSKLVTIFRYGFITDSASQNVFSSHQHMHSLKNGKEKRLFT